jgi:hypothetical protein
LKKRYLLFPCLLIVSALFLAACGGSGDNAEAEIEDAIETSATVNDPANCTELETLNFSEQSSTETGKAALKACEAEAEEEDGSKAKSVAVSEVEVDGEKATAQAAVTGGSLEGQTVAIALVEEDGQWKLDELTGFVDFDQGEIASQFKAQLEKGGEVEPEAIACIVAGLKEAPPEEAEELVLSGDSAPIEELAESCL